MSFPLPPPPPPPPPNSTALPDLLLTALSLVVLFTSPKHHTHTHSHSLKLKLKLKSISTTTNPRFHLRPSTAITMSKNPNPNFPSTHPFPTPQSLSDWLRPRLQPDAFAAWGTKPGTKNVHNLWLEVAEGETSLIDTTPPVRNLEVISVRILAPGNRILVESHQELSDGSVRSRNRPLSEKLKTGEDINSAVKRAVMEELGSILPDSVNYAEVVKIIPDSYEKKVEQRDSFSYPGLPGCYVMHTVEALVDGLPEEEFVTEEQNEYGECKSLAMEAVSVRKHFWKWVPRDSL